MTKTHHISTFFAIAIGVFLCGSGYAQSLGYAPSPEPPPTPSAPEAAEPTVIPWASIDSQLRNRLLRSLYGYHHLPDRDRLEALSPRIAPMLRGAVMQPEIGSMVRRRALVALGKWPTESTFDVYVWVLVNLDDEQDLQYETMVLLGTHFPQRIDHPVVDKYLQSSNQNRQLQAVEALKKAGTETARQKLERFQSKVTDKVVSKKVDSILSDW
jgi:hypothetical protein